jgi:hypothetical protein
VRGGSSLKIEITTAEAAKGAVKASKVSEEQETQLTEMLQKLVKDEGVKITLGEGESMPAFKACIQTIAVGMGVGITLKTVKKKNLILIWRV